MISAGRCQPSKKVATPMTVAKIAPKKATVERQRGATDRNTATNAAVANVAWPEGSELPVYYVTPLGKTERSKMTLSTCVVRLAAPKINATIREAAQRRRHSVSTKNPIAASVATTMGKSASRLTDASCNDCRRAVADASAAWSSTWPREDNTKW